MHLHDMAFFFIDSVLLIHVYSINVPLLACAMFFTLTISTIMCRMR